MHFLELNIMLQPFQYMKIEYQLMTEKYHCHRNLENICKARLIFYTLFSLFYFDQSERLAINHTVVLFYAACRRSMFRVPFYEVKMKLQE
jgi:hypothetical protein